MRVEVYCIACHQRYDQIVHQVVGNGPAERMRVYDLFNYVPCCGACGSNDIRIGVSNPYRKTQPPCRTVDVQR